MAKISPADCTGQTSFQGTSGKSHELEDAGESLLSGLVGVEFPPLGHGHGVGENPNFFLGHRQDLLDLGECSRLVHGEEVVPPLVIAEMQQAVVGKISGCLRAMANRSF